MTIPSDGNTEMPKFPEHLIGRVTSSTFYILLDEDIRSAEELADLIDMMGHHTESRFYLFTPAEAAINPWVSKAISNNQICVLESEPSYYLRSSPRDFIHVRQNPRWAWEQDLLANGKPFVRFHLQLTEITRARVFAKALEKSPSPFKVEPNFMGIGLNMPVVWRWLSSCRWIRALRTRLSR